MTPAQHIDLTKRLSNLLRAGRVEAVDLANARCKVRFGDIVTAFLPFVSAKAGEDRTWHPPEVGEQVLVLSPSGELSAGFVLGGVYTTAFPPPSTSPDVSRMLFKDGATATYDRALHSLNLDLPAGGSSLTITVNGDATISASGNALVEAAGTTTVSSGGNIRLEPGSGIVTVAGDIVTDAGVSLNTHIHDLGVGTTGQPVT